MNKNLAPLITWLPSRSQLDLNGAWRSIIDVYDVGITGPFGRDDGETAGNPNWGFAYDRGRNSPGRSEYDFDTSPEIEVLGLTGTDPQRVLTERCHAAVNGRYPHASEAKRREVLERLETLSNRRDRS